MAIRCSSVLAIAAFSAIIAIITPSSHGQPANQTCKNPVSCDPPKSFFPDEDRISIEYANRTIRDVSYSDTYVDLTVHFGEEGANETRKLRFIICGCPDDSPKDVTAFFINPKAVYVQESPAIHMVSELQPSLDVIRYVNDITYVYNPKLLEKQDNDPSSVQSVSVSGEIKFSTLIDDADLGGVLASVFGFKDLEKGLVEAGIPVLPIAEVNEVSPLARAEWMKVIGVFLGEPKAAMGLFRIISTTYNNAVKQAAAATRRPSVFFNFPSVPFLSTYDPTKTPDENYQWTQPGGEQYIAQFARDANGDYRYSYDDSETADKSIHSNISTVLKDFGSARVLLNAFGSNDPTLVRSLGGLLAGDNNDTELEAELKKFDAVRCGDVWSNANRLSKDGALDYFESAIARPDELLLDFVKILHPQINLGDHVFKYVFRYSQADEVGLSCPYTDLIDEPSDGSAFVDIKLTIDGIDRFEVRDEIEDRIYPGLENEGINRTKVDIQFTKPHVENEANTELTVRLDAYIDDADDEESASRVKKAFTKAFPDNKVELIDSEIVTAEGVRDRGLSNGGIAGVVIASLAGLVIVVCLIGKCTRSVGTGTFAPM